MKRKRVPRKVSKYYDGRRLVVAVRTSDFEEAKIIANEIFKIRKDELIASYAIIKGSNLFYDGGYNASNVVAVFRTQED